MCLANRWRQRLLLWPGTRPSAKDQLGTSHSASRIPAVVERNQRAQSLGFPSHSSHHASLRSWTAPTERHRSPLPTTITIPAHPASLTRSPQCAGKHSSLLHTNVCMCRHPSAYRCTHTTHEHMHAHTPHMYTAHMHMCTHTMHLHEINTPPT